MKQNVIFSILSLTTMLVMVACKGKTGVENPAPSMYYWRTTYEPTQKETAWMKTMGIRKMYVRMFDVTEKDGEIKPQATIGFNRQLPDSISIIPTVFIDEEVIGGSMTMDTLAELITKRIRKMSETHKFHYDEVQMDCDWTRTSEEGYFRLLKCMKKVEPQLTISATIRLHQLNMKVPPVDYGALMLYNTGDFRNAESDRNPILDERDVAPYLKYLKKYPLPLCAAYPDFTWKLLFAGIEFKGILYGEDLTDTTTYRKRNDREYDVIGSRIVLLSASNIPLRIIPGERVKVWSVTEQERERVKQMVERERQDINDQTIIFR